jgi:GAF domain-containing protein
MNKTARYTRLYDQLVPLLAKSPSPVAAMATVSAVLFHKMPYFSWCGFYVLLDGELIVGPYQGPVACQILKKHTGVCWAAIDRNETVLVSDVEQFPGHIACDSRTKSELVVPVRNAAGKVVAVFDIDSHDLNSFDEADAAGMEKIIKMTESFFV